MWMQEDLTDDVHCPASCALHIVEDRLGDNDVIQSIFVIAIIIKYHIYMLEARRAKQ